MLLIKDNPNSSKIIRLSPPYFYLLNSRFQGGRRAHKAIFLGNDFKNMPQTLDRSKYIEQTNLCLGYMRRECRGCRLYYKPHPNETDEHINFDLRGFEIVVEDEDDVAEIFFWKNFQQIKYVFAIASTAAWSAYNLGLNAYTFVRPVTAVIGKDIGSALDYFDQLPETFFINDYQQPLRENRKLPQPDSTGEKYLLADLRGGHDVWFVVGDPGMLIVYISFARLIRQKFPKKKINLIIPQHHRWQMIKEVDYRDYFDRVVTFPRSFYSLRPRRFAQILKTIRAVRALRLCAADTLLLFANTNLIENCFLSYFKNKKIAVQFRDYFEINYGLKESKILKGEPLKVRFTTQIFSRIIEPIFGLHRTIYLEYGDGRAINLVRYIKPATKIYSRVYLLS